MNQFEMIGLGPHVFANPYRTYEDDGEGEACGVLTPSGSPCGYDRGSHAALASERPVDDEAEAQFAEMDKRLTARMAQLASIARTRGWDRHAFLCLGGLRSGWCRCGAAELQRQLTRWDER